MAKITVTLYVDTTVQLTQQNVNNHCYFVKDQSIPNCDYVVEAKKNDKITWEGVTSSTDPVQEDVQVSIVEINYSPGLFDGKESEDLLGTPKIKGKPRGQNGSIIISEGDIAEGTVGSGSQPGHIEEYTISFTVDNQPRNDKQELQIFQIDPLIRVNAN